MLRARPHNPAGAVVSVLIGLLAAVLCLGAANSLILGIVGCVLAAGIAIVAVLGAEAVGFGCLVLATFFGPMDALRPPGAGLFTAADVFYILGFGLLLPRRLTHPLRLPPYFAIGAAGLGAMTVLTSVTSATMTESILTGFRLIFSLLMLPIGLALYRPSLFRIDVLAWSYIVGQVANTAFAVTLGASGQGRLIGLTQHPNYFGMDGAFGCALALYLAIRPGAKYDASRLFAWGAGAICLVSVLLSGSRTAMIAVFVIAVFYPIVERSLKALFVVATGAVVAVVAFAWMLAAFGPGSAIARLMPGSKSAQYSDQAREGLFSTYWPIFKAHPIFGRGFQTNDYLSHDVLLEFGVAVGVVGIVFFLIYGWSFVRILFTGGRLHGLGYVAIAYASMLPTTPTIWDRNLWSALVLAICATGVYTTRTGTAEPEPELASPPPPPALHRAEPERQR